MNSYTKEEFLKAAEIGEVSMIDARHIVSLLDEAREKLKVEKAKEILFRRIDGTMDTNICNHIFPIYEDTAGLHYLPCKYCGLIKTNIPNPKP